LSRSIVARRKHGRCRAFQHANPPAVIVARSGGVVWERRAVASSCRSRRPMVPSDARWRSSAPSTSIGVSRGSRRLSVSDCTECERRRQEATGVASAFTLRRGSVRSPERGNPGQDPRRSRRLALVGSAQRPTRSAARDPRAVRNRSDRLEATPVLVPRVRCCAVGRPCLDATGCGGGWLERWVTAWTSAVQRSCRRDRATRGWLAGSLWLPRPGW
jgi:hypothetical protein